MSDCFLDRFLSKFAREVYMDFRDGEVFYSCRERSGSVPIVVYVTDDTGVPTLLSADPELPPSQAYRTINLLAVNEDLHPDADRFAWLAAFIGCVIKKTNPPRALLKPRLVFQNSENLHNSFGVYYKTILDQAAILGGAMKCVFK